jgi:hypothetical protein
MSRAAPSHTQKTQSFNVCRLLSVFLLTAANALAANAASTAAAPGAALVQRDFAARSDRFIQLPAATPGTAPSFHAMVQGRSYAFGSQAIEVRVANQMLRYSFVGGAAVAPDGGVSSPTLYHWLVGPPSTWRTGLHSHSRLRYAQVWPGVDAVFNGVANGLKYHYELQNGVDPSVVKMQIDGADAVQVAADGSLSVRVGQTLLHDAAPTSTQTVGGQVQSVATRYTVTQVATQSWMIGFAFTGLQAGAPLVIDPAWTGASGLVGGNAADQVYAVARDASGNVYACGVTSSNNLPALGAVSGIGTSGTSNNGGDDAFVVRFNANGVPQSVTYLGGNGNESCNGIVVDGSGNMAIAGGTTSTNFPLKSGSSGADPQGRFNTSVAKTRTDRDAFVTALVPAGNALIYSGLIGGSEDDQANAIAVDGSGRIYVTGYSACTTAGGSSCSSSTPFPAVVGPRVTHAVYSGAGRGLDAFVARVNATGSGLDYAGFIGGDGSYEMGMAIQVDASNNAYVAGFTDSGSGLDNPGGFRTSINSRSASPPDPADGFVAKVAADGSALSQFTLLTGTAPTGVAGSGSGGDRALALALDSSGNVVVGGETDSANFPANDAGTQQAAAPQANKGAGMNGFVVGLTSDLQQINGATYVGGSGYTSVEALAADGLVAFAAGTTSAGTGFSTVAQTGLSNAAPGRQDGFLVKLNSRGFTSYTYAGYLGTSANDAVHALSAVPLNGQTTLSVGGMTTASGSTGWANPNSAALAGSSGDANGIVLRIDPFGPPNALAVQGGAGQSTLVSTSFATPLSVRVTDAESLAVSNVVVTFQGPATGASLQQTSYTATTDSNGVATVTVAANAVGGGYNVTASIASLQTPIALTNVPLTSQTITFTSTAPANAVYNGSAYTVTATGGGLRQSCYFHH